MRLWHYQLIHYLPKSQLLAQWRELNSIFKKQDKHILINYIYEYPKDDLNSYANMIIKEFWLRGYATASIKLSNYLDYFESERGNMKPLTITPFKDHHDNRYLIQCFYNLQEKFDRGQKDFTLDNYNKLIEFMRQYINI